MINKETPFFLTVDTEGDNIWDRPQKIAATNVEKLHRFQELCNKYAVKPIYLTNYEASENKFFQRMVHENSEKLEIGLHLHAWNSPPDYNLTGNDYYYQPYLHEYPTDIVKSKTEYLIKKLQDTFGTEIISHRGGRYSISDVIFESLAENEIRVDCSVVPGFNWKTSLVHRKETADRILPKAKVGYMKFFRHYRNPCFHTDSQIYFPEKG